MTPPDRPNWAAQKAAARAAFAARGGRLLSIPLDATALVDLAAIRARQGLSSDAEAIIWALDLAAAIEPPPPTDPASPDHPCWNGLRLAARQRMAHAVATLRRHGSLNRADIIAYGKVSKVQATMDLNTIRERLPGLMRYDTVLKRYVPTSPAERQGT